MKQYELDESLIWTSHYGHLEIVKLLLEKGANVHAYDNLSIRYASGKGHLEIVKLLLERGANVHADDNLSLLWASHYGHLEVVKVIKEHIKKGNYGKNS